jgi:two-component system, NtrC family, response regulator AtoC
MPVTKRTASILVAEDEPEIRNCLELQLRCRGYAVQHAENGDEVLNYVREGSGSGVSLILLDIMMPCRDGIETLREIRRFDKTLPIIVLSGLSSPTTIVEAMKLGANDFLAKPVGNDQLIEAIHRALEPRIVVQNPSRETFLSRSASQFASGPSWMMKMESLLRQVGASDAPVLLGGETGVGKEVLARLLHANSPRATNRFLKVNCAALPSELIESELFGYERGAFTGAVKAKPGKFDMADGGTILLDEIGDMDFRLQAKLLHVLQDQEFERLGGSETIRVNVRIMAATHADLENSIREGRFREDLYYRLNVINIHVPPLRERPDEIPLLAAHFLKKFSSTAGVNSGEYTPEITPEFHQALLAYHWPGNIRELENFMRKYAVLQDPGAAAEELRVKSGTKQRSAPMAAPQVAPPEPTVPATLERVTEVQKRAEAEAILAALNRTRWNRKQAASLLCVDYKALLYKMKKLEIDRNPLELSSPEEPGWTPGNADAGTPSWTPST